MGRPKKPRRSIACSFSLPPELQEKYDYIRKKFGLSTWIQSQMWQLKINDMG